MSIEELDKYIEDIEHDFLYYKNMGFDILASKFERDLLIAKQLRKSIGGNDENVRTS